VLEGKAVHEETERLIERANRAIVQSLLLVEENRSSINQAWARLRFLYCKVEEMKPKAAQLGRVLINSSVPPINSPLRPISSRQPAPYRPPGWPLEII
jgi:hypothetical protein